MRASELVAYVDVDDTLVRSTGSTRIPMPAAIEHVRHLHAQGVALYCWSAGGAEYACRTAQELGIEELFFAFLPKPHVLIDDQPPAAWPRFVVAMPHGLASTTVEDHIRAVNPSMATDPITITRAELTADESRALIAALNTELRGAYSEPGANHFALDADEVAPGRGAFLVVRQHGTAIGCGAVRRLDADSAELKRMYVAPDARGHGLGRRLLDALEGEARQLGVRRLVLETGIRQEAALVLYRAAGFEPIPLYGEYCLSPDTSICLGKQL